METPDYGWCPRCGMRGQSRERRPDGNDRCVAGHQYPSRDSVTDAVQARAIRDARSAKTGEVTLVLRHKESKAWRVAPELPRIRWLDDAIAAGAVTVDYGEDGGRTWVTAVNVWTPFGRSVATPGNWVVRTVQGQIVAMEDKEFHEVFIILD